MLIIWHNTEFKAIKVAIDVNIIISEGEVFGLYILEANCGKVNFNLEIKGWGGLLKSI